MLKNFVGAHDVNTIDALKALLGTNTLEVVMLDGVDDLYELLGEEMSVGPVEPTP